MVACRMKPCDEVLQHQEKHRHVDEGDREAGEPGRAGRARAHPQDHTGRGPVRGEEREGRHNVPPDTEAEKKQEREERGQGLEPERIDPLRVLRPFLGQCPAEQIGVRESGAGPGRHGHHGDRRA